MAGLSPYDQLIAACEKGHLETVKELVPSKITGDGPNCQVSPLHVCARKGYTDIGEYLIKHGKASMKRRDKNVDSPLHYAAKYGHQSFAKMLLKSGCPVHIKGFDEATPLHYAAEHEHGEVFCVLLEYGADVFAKNKKGEIPLNRALSSDLYGEKRANPVILKELFQKMPQVTYNRIHDVYKGFAIKRFHDKAVCQILKEYMPDYLHLVLKHISDLTVPHIEDMLDMDWDVKILSPDGDTTIHAAVGGYVTYMEQYKQLDSTLDRYNPWKRNVEDVILLLLSHGADINAQNQLGETAFFMLCKASSCLRSNQPLSKLIELGADVNICNNENETGVQHLIRNVKPDMLSLVLTAGSILHNLKPDILLKTVYENAEDNSQMRGNQVNDVVKYVLSAGFKTRGLKTAGTKQEQKCFEEIILRNEQDARMLYECGHQFSTELLDISNYSAVAESLCDVHSLKVLTCCTIRQCLHPNAWVATEKLELPTYLKKLVKLEK